MFIVFLNRDSVQIMLDLYLSIPIWVLLKWYYFSYFKFQLFITTILENNWLLDPETVQWNLEGLTRATYFVLLYEILWEITQIIMLFSDKDGFLSSFTHCTSLSHPQGGDWTQGRQHAGLALHQWASLQPRLYTFFLVFINSTVSDGSGEETFSLLFPIVEQHTHPVPLSIWDIIHRFLPLSLP